jgi:hypothetical protein
MAKYLVLWELDTSKIPEDAKARKAQWLAGQQLVMMKLKEGIIKEWGEFAGELSGYMTMEGSAMDLAALTVNWVPMVKFTAKEVMTIDEINKVTKALPE